MTREEFNSEYNAKSKKDEQIAYLSFLAEKNLEYFKINNMTYVSFGQAVKMLEEIYDNQKLELEAEYKRGWKDRAAQSDLESKSCEGCVKKEMHGFGWVRCSELGTIFQSLNFYCSEWEQR